MFSLFMQIKDYDGNIMETRHSTHDDLVEMYKFMNMMWEQNRWPSYCYEKGREFYGEPLKRVGEKDG